jgi:DNA modification methylase
MKIRDRIKELRRVKASELLPNPKNWRTHPVAQQDALKGILAEVGFAGAVLVRELDDGSLMLIDGHMRAETTHDQEIPVLILDVDEAESDKLLATFDPIAAMAESDAHALDALLRNVDTGSEALSKMLAELAEGAGLYLDEKEVIEDEVPEPPVDPVTKSGDLWILGDHRVLCGDSTKAEDVTRLMAGVKAELVITDPPYGVSYSDKNAFLNAIDKGNRNQTKIENDHLNKKETQAMWGSAFKNMADAMGAGAVVYCFMPQGGDQMMMMMMMMEGGIEPRHELIWLKNNHVLGRSDYNYKHEPILYAWKKGGHKFYGDFSTSVIECKKPHASKLHPTMKPVELVAILAKNSSQLNETIYDPFLGSGTTLIAADQLGRKCYGMEISPAYCDVIVQRWEKLTGKTATLEVKNG